MLAEFSISLLGTIVAAIACFISLSVFFKALKLTQRLQNVLDNVQAAKVYIKHCEISNSVLQLAAGKFNVDADINEFEVFNAILSIENGMMGYSREKMDRSKNTVLKPLSPLKAGAKKSVEDASSRKKEMKSEKRDEKSKSKKKKEGSEPSKDVPSTPAEAKKDLFEKPKNDGNVDKKDPNYQTLANMNNDAIFGENKKKEKFKAPGQINKADAKDPQYETLAGIGNDLFNDDGGDKKDEKSNKKHKDEKVKKKEFKEPEKIKKVDAKDPQYETLNEVKDDIFKQ